MHVLLIKNRTIFASRNIHRNYSLATDTIAITNVRNGSQSYYTIDTNEIASIRVEAQALHAIGAMLLPKYFEMTGSRLVNDEGLLWDLNTMCIEWRRRL